MGSTHPREGYSRAPKELFVAKKTVVKDFRRQFAGDVKRTRKALGMTQEMLAEAVGCDARDIRYIEKDARCPTAERFLRICGALEIPAERYLEIYKKN